MTAGAERSAPLERFDAYMDRCLYAPGSGFYTSGSGSAGGRRGDFITSPEVGPLFADVVSRALDHWWVEMGRPEPFTVHDAGTGPGALTRALQRAPGAGAPVRRVVGFDHGGTLPAELGGSVVVANELLDNLPFRVLERGPDGWLEVWVHHDDAQRPAESLVPLDGAEAHHLVPEGCRRLPVGARIPILERARRWVGDVLARGPAAVLIFDYGAADTAALGLRGGWLRTYRRHERGDDPYVEPGRWDITTDVAVDQLPAPTEVTSQAAFLRRWGIDELVEEGRRHWRSHAAAPDLAALRMRSRVSEAEALLDPAGLGGWLACLWRP